MSPIRVEVPRPVARVVARKLIEDLRNRKGLGNEWEQIDNDVRTEILLTWSEIIRDELSS